MRIWLALVLSLAATACGTDAPTPADSPDATAIAPDAGPGCPPCGAGAICVERFDGTCGTEGPVCVTTALDCPADSCSTDCEQALCGGEPYQCENRAPCGSEAPGAFTCYGP
jgi:hypothetical protein